jgi:hypothetical protein
MAAISPAAQAHTIDGAEKALAEKFAASRAAWDYETEERLAGEFESGLRALLADPATLDRPFGELRENIDIVTSDDGRLRIYSWNNGLGGPYGNGGWRNIIQFVNPSGRVALTSYERASSPDDYDREGMMWDNAGFEIYTVESNGKTLYLLESSGTSIGAMWGNRSIEIYTAGSDNLSRETLFDTGRRLLSDISIDQFDITEDYDEDLFRFDPATLTVYVPLVSADYKVTSNYLIYRWDGTHFLYRGTGKVSPPIAAPPAAVSAPAPASYTYADLLPFDAAIPAGDVQSIDATCFVEIWPENREFEDEDSDEAAAYYAMMDDLAYYMSETRTMFEGMGVNSVVARQRYLSFPLTGGTTVVVDTKNIGVYDALLYREGQIPICIDIVSPEESGIGDYLNQPAATAADVSIAENKGWRFYAFD